MNDTQLQTSQTDELHEIYQGKVVAKTCKYDTNAVAVNACRGCGAGLCSFCGYFEDSTWLGKKVRFHFCNECHNEMEEDRTGECWYCGSPLEAIYENNGFTEPAGPSHWEITGWKKCECGVGGGH